MVASEGKQIYSLIPKVMEDLGAIRKQRKNSGKGYKFRGIEDVLNQLHPVLIKHGVSISQQSANHRHETIEENTVSGSPSKVKRIYRSFLDMTVTFYAPDGSFISNTASGEGIDYNDDKATSKAMSAAYKYAVFLGLCVPVEDGELTDSDGSSGPPPSGSGEVVITSPESSEPASQLKNLKDIAANGTQQGKHSYSENEQCTEEQRNQVIALTQQIGQDISWLKSLIQKKGKSKLAELTYGEASGLILKLDEKAKSLEATARFS